MSVFFRCRLGIIQRSRGGSAIRRSAYQTCQKMEAPDGRVFNYSKNHGSHGRVQTITMAPPGSPPWVQDPHTLWVKAVLAERRCDAQEARTIEFSLSRSLQRDLWEGCVRAVAAPLLATGMVVQADIHAPLAADGGLNPHVHLAATLRRIEGDGFSSRKAREWNAKFLGQAKQMRAEIAKNLNEFCARHDIDYRADPRSNYERGLPAPEPTLPRWNSVAAKRTGQRTRWMEERDAERAVRRHLAALEASLKSINEDIRVEQAYKRRRISDRAIDRALTTTPQTTAQHHAIWERLAPLPAGDAVRHDKPDGSRLADLAESYSPPSP